MPVYVVEGGLLRRLLHAPVNMDTIRVHLQVAWVNRLWFDETREIIRCVRTGLPDTTFPTLPNRTQVQIAEIVAVAFLGRLITHSTDALV